MGQRELVGEVWQSNFSKPNWWPRSATESVIYRSNDKSSHHDSISEAIVKRKMRVHFSISCLPKRGTRLSRLLVVLI